MIAVGVDGSDGSRHALRWALAEGALRGVAVETVTAWPTRDEVFGQPVEAERAMLTAQDIADRLVHEELGHLADPPVVTSHVVHGDPVEALLNLSARAELLVVGSHETSSVRHVMLGSVSEACSRMADCPVVVLPMGSPNLAGRGGQPSVFSHAGESKPGQQAQE
jgi:nucleotide-binding universal stress UspA family protein